MAEGDIGNVYEVKTRVAVPDVRLVGYVIGKRGGTITGLMRETSTYIHYEKESNEFIIEGEPANQYSAKIKVKEILANGVKTPNYLRFPFINSNGQRYVLEPKSWDSPEFKVVLKEELNKDPSHTSDYSEFTRQITEVLKSIYDEKKKDVINHIWSHFGHIYVSNVNLGEGRGEFDAQELLGHVKWDNTSNATKWRTKFKGGIDSLESHNLKEWMRNREERDPPFIRYEFVYFTPSCRMIRVKTFLGLEIDVTTNALTYKSIPKCEPISNLIKSSDSYPYFYICGSSEKKAAVDVFQPAEELDFRFIIDSGSTSQDQNRDEEVDTLFKFFRDNLRVIPEDGLELPHENRPSDFDPCYARVSERRTYAFTSEDDEQFTVKLSYEYSHAHSETIVDIHLQYDPWDEILEDGTWNPQKIADKIPHYMKCASSLARILKFQEGIPEEILVRGEKAQKAYKKALESGQAKYCRVPVMLIGQSRAGKTSLLRSLKGEKFNPEEDSTDGVKLHRSLSMAKEDDWHEDETTIDRSLMDCTARAVAKNFQAPIDIKELELDQEESQEEPPVTHDLSDAFDETYEENEVTHDEERRNISLHEKIDVEIKNQESNERDSTKLPSVARDPSLLHRGTLENHIPEEVSKIASDFVQHPEKFEKEDCIHFVTLDFAGQPVYNATHPVFLPQKGIYILVHSLENDIHAKATPIVKQGSSKRITDCDCPMTNMDYLEFWLSFVASLWKTERASIIALERFKKGDTPFKIPSSTPKRKNLPKRVPPVFLVCTHADKLKNPDEAERATRSIYSYLVRDDKDAPGKDHIVRGIYTVDNTVSGQREEKTVKDLKSHIYQVASALPHVNEVVPIRWLKFEKLLSDLSIIKNKKCIPLDEARSAAVECQISTNNDEFDTVLNYLHDLKVLIHYEKTNLVIIDIQWLLNMIVKVITVKPIEDWEEGYEDLWEKLETNGILERDLINHIWENEATANSLLMIMQRYSLLCLWKKLNAPDIFLVPSMLMNNNAKEANDLLIDQNTSRTIVVRFKSAHLPLGIFPRLLVIITNESNKKWPDSRQPKFYNNFCRFYDIGGESGESFDLLVTSDMKTITSTVINENGIKGLPLQKFCRFLVEFLDEKLKFMQSSFPWMKTLEFEFCIRCPICYPSSQTCKHHNVIDCTRDACLHFLTEKELRNQQPRCYVNHTNKRTIIDESFYRNWFDTGDDKQTSTTKVIAETVRLLALEERSSTSEGSQNHEIVPYAVHGQELSLPGNSDMTIAKFKELVENLKSYKSSIKDPPDEMVKEFRDLCQKLKVPIKEEFIKELRKYLPSGTTGPLCNGNTLVKDMDFHSKQSLSQALTGKTREWRVFAEKAGISNDDIEFYDKREKNPVLTILDERCGDMTLEKLYNLIVESGANAVADKHL